MRSWLLWPPVSYIASLSLLPGSGNLGVPWGGLPNAVWAKGQSLGSFSHWIMNFAIAVISPLWRHPGAYPFIFFAAMTALQFFVVLFVFPETKGISLERNASSESTSAFRLRVILRRLPLT